MGEPVETLEDLLRPSLCAVCIGINRAPKSVAVGHYYQGQLGRRFFARLHEAGVVPRAAGWADDIAFSNGIGFTDLVKRPTRSSNDLLREELEHGEIQLREKLERLRPQLVIFTFKKTADRLFGKLTGCGYMRQLDLAGAAVFVMPPPFGSREEVTEKLDELRSLFEFIRRECGLCPCSLTQASL